MDAGNQVDYLRSIEGRWLREYQACKVFGWTHEQYMDTPQEAINWLMHIHGKVVEFERSKAASTRG